jgi:hypothetical protein
MPTPPLNADSSSSPFDRGMKWLCRSEREVRWLGRASALAAALYFVILGVAETGPINKYGHDVFLLLDGGWRILNGQVPYRDFYLALGPLEYMITACGMLLTHGGPHGIAIGNVIFGVAVGIWGWLLARKRMPAVAALLVTAWLILTATSPTPLGEVPGIMSPAMIYNRHGYALLGLVLVECGFASERSRFWGGASSGIAMALLAFLKLNFFGVAGLLLLASVPLRREEMPRAWGFLAGLAGGLAAFVLYLQFAIPAFLYDMRLAAQARGSLLSAMGAIGGMAGNAEVVTLAIMTVVAMLLIVPGGLRKRSAVRVLLLGGIVLVTGFLFSQTNQGDTGFQLASLWIIVLLGLLMEAYPHGKEKAAISAVVLLGLGSVFAGFFLNAESVRALLRYRAPSVLSQGVSITGGGMEQLKFYDTQQDHSIHRFDNGHFVVDHANDGLALLRNFSTQDESVLTIGSSDPFPYILRRKPAHGGSPWLIAGDNFPKTRMLDEAQVFGDAKLIMMPHYPNSTQESDSFLGAAYQPYLAQHFTFVASSQWWSLYRRNK